VKILDESGQPVKGVEIEDGALEDVPTGGPYTIKLGETTIEPVFVGDLWLLAGQSNMEGVGDLEDVTPPHPKVMALGMDGTWRRAEEPLHWLIDSPDEVHWPKPSLSKDERKAISDEFHKTRHRGAGMGLPFGVTMTRATGVPVGLVPVAHGGTSMAEWDPEKKDEEGKSLYGSMLRQVRAAGGRVKGVLWDQGESDANPSACREYSEAMIRFVEELRDDLDDDDLPIYAVQIGRFVRSGDPSAWNAIREAQRKLPEAIEHFSVVPSLDLELDDPIHIGTQGLKRLGRRLAWVALHDLFDYPVGTPLRLRAVETGDHNMIRVAFDGVDLGGTRPPRVLGEEQESKGGEAIVGLQPLRHILGFSIRQDDGTEIPLIFDAVVDSQHKDTVILQLSGPVPPGAELWYGYGFNPACNLADGLDMAAPAFGPVPLESEGVTRK
jgi:sialate O-acetylesterase